ncbi:autoinducer binding domain-containing protein [Pseudomonas sp. BP8]|uniref:autoinducer binding domain-containing protein n=1 Tax=Pseudomonas sp. BP8 TaxID=2817864 RepID=UPI001AE7022E|nr:autoinducer binding domain-containing protein [Pseudomonas sp. BP8]MBP2260398.1 LuxR family transcriptional regulator [Pseudomonas sp. BP8]HDS1735686.1 autoinducer binding domain-containing protein [Pseudomonas putida]
MSQWSSDQLQVLLAQREPQQLFSRALRLVEDLGMSYLGLTLHIHIAASRPKIILYNNYPRAWTAYYTSDEVFKQDPVANQCHRSTLAALWTDDLYSEVPEFREKACSHGLRHGWTQSVHDQRHNETQLSVARPLGAIDICEFYENSARVLWLCHNLHALLSEHHLAGMAPVPKLTERELEVLKWSADGKTAADIARILSLSTSTVNFHIRSLISKTNAANKAGAIAIAASRGLL